MFNIFEKNYKIGKGLGIKDDLKWIIKGLEI